MRVVCSGQLSNNASIEIVEAESLSGRSEFGVKICGEVASVSLVSRLKGGDLVVKTVSKTIRIKSGKLPAIENIKQPPSLSDIAKT